MSIINLSINLDKIDKSKEEREAKNDKNYLGNGKEFVFDNEKTNSTVKETSNDDLPF